MTLSLPMNVTYQFANATTTQYLSYLDTDFNQLAWTLNGIGNGTVSLANIKIDGGNIAKSALAANGSPTSQTFLRGDGTWAIIPSTAGGTVTSINVSGGSTGLTSSGGPVTTTGTITLGGVLGVANGGTGVTSSTGNGSVVLSNGATLTNANIGSISLTSPLGITSGGTGIGTIPNSGQILIGNSVGYQLGTITAGTGINITNSPGNITISYSGGNGASGTVTSVNGSGNYGFNLTGGPITSSGTLTISPPVPGSSGNVMVSNGTAWISQAAAAGSNGTVTSVNASSANGFSFTGGPVTTSGTLTLNVPTPGTSGNVLISNGTSWVSQVIGSSNPTSARFTALDLDGIAAESISISPIANPTTGSIANTYSSLVVQATTQKTSNREFAGVFGLTNTLGHGVANNNGDKVALYAGMDITSPTSGDAWALNTVVTLGNSAPTLIQSFGWECDINNYSGDKTTTNFSTNGVNVGTAYTGIGYLSTAAIWFTGANSLVSPSEPYYNLPKHENGIWATSGSVKNFVIYDQSDSLVGFYQTGSHTTGIDLGPGTYTFAAINVGSNYIKGTGGAIIGTSDVRTKTDIKDTDLGLNFINNLRPVSFIYDKEEYRIHGDATVGETKTRVKFTRRHHGLIAQEVRALIDPDKFAGWVLEDKNDPNSEQGLRYDEFIAPLIKAVQELTKRLEAAEDKLKGL